MIHPLVLVGPKCVVASDCSYACYVFSARRLIISCIVATSTASPRFLRMYNILQLHKRNIHVR